MMLTFPRAGLFALLSLATLSVHAQDAATPACRAYVDGQWRTLGRGSLESCIKAVGQAVPAYNAQGFKFGAAGTEMLAADPHYYYRSQDGGRSWTPVGLKSAVKAVQDAAPLQAVALTPAAEAAARAAPAPTAIVAEPAAPAPSADAEPATTSAAAIPAPAAELELRTCNLHDNGAWQSRGALTLEACGNALDKTPDRYDEAGYKYAYWGKLFLAADAQSILRSDTGAEWTPLRPR